jgi:hypothetical protein
VLDAGSRGRGGTCGGGGLRGRTPFRPNTPRVVANSTSSLPSACAGRPEGIIRPVSRTNQGLGKDFRSRSRHPPHHLDRDPHDRNGTRESFMASSSNPTKTTHTDIQMTVGVTDREITMTAATQTIAETADRCATTAMRGQRVNGANHNPPIKVDYLEAGSSGPVVMLVHSSVSGARSGAG